MSAIGWYSALRFCFSASRLRQRAGADDPTKERRPEKNSGRHLRSAAAKPAEIAAGARKQAVLRRDDDEARRGVVLVERPRAVVLDAIADVVGAGRNGG